MCCTYTLYIYICFFRRRAKGSGGLPGAPALPNGAKPQSVIITTINIS